jgi:16S rRNA (cytosine1402-N4)-methyltransferase
VTSPRSPRNEAGAHRTVLLNEAVDALSIKGNGTYVDATFGRGGHSREILSRLGISGKLIAIDRDPEALASAAAITDSRLALFQMEFGRIGRVAAQADLSGVDGVLLDLGVSSPNSIRRSEDSASAGRAARHEDGSRPRRNGGRVACASFGAGYREVIKRHGEERFAKQIARAIVAARSVGPVDSTRQLAQIVAKAVPSREPSQDPATRTFQAIRIHINQELEELEIALPQCLEMLNPGGRLVVISFHSLEDRIVKQYMRAQAQHGSLPERLPVRAAICQNRA